jgi:hypothetical protein
MFINIFIYASTNSFFILHFTLDGRKTSSKHAPLPKWLPAKNHDKMLFSFISNEAFAFQLSISGKKKDSFYVQITSKKYITFFLENPPFGNLVTPKSNYISPFLGCKLW